MYISFLDGVSVPGPPYEAPTTMTPTAEMYGLTVLEAKDQGTVSRSLPSELQEGICSAFLLWVSSDVPSQKDTVIPESGPAQIPLLRESHLPRPDFKLRLYSSVLWVLAVCGGCGDGT